MIALLPHWIVDGQPYYSQFAAWQAVKKTGDVGRFYFNEYIYDQYDWSQDPKDSWDMLVRARCLQLRHKYKNLKLFYSAGRDSHHILRAFAENNIPIDELVLTYFPLNPIRHREFQDWILPMAHEYKKINPKVKITTIQVDAQDYNKYFSDDWLERAKGAQNINGTFQPSDFTWILNKFNIVKNSSTGIIFGIDKPKIYLKDNKIYSTVVDQTFIYYYNNIQDYELFYFTADMPELHIKQCHMLVDYLEEHYPTADQEFLTEFVDRPSSKYYDEYCIATGRGPAVNVKVPAQNGKNKFSPDHIANRMLQKIIKDQAPNAVARWQEAILWSRDNIHEAFVVPEAKWHHHGFRTIPGKPYFIRDWTPKITDQTS